MDKNLNEIFGLDKSTAYLPEEFDYDATKDKVYQNLLPVPRDQRVHFMLTLVFDLVSRDAPNGTDTVMIRRIAKRLEQQYIETTAMRQYLRK